MGGCVFVVVVVVVTHFLRAPCFKTGYASASAGFARITPLFKENFEILKTCLITPPSLRTIFWVEGGY